MSVNIKKALSMLLELHSECRPFIEVALSELASLEKCESKLSALENAGVDNWEGYQEAMENQ